SSSARRSNSVLRASSSRAAARASLSSPSACSWKATRISRSTRRCSVSLLIDCPVWSARQVCAGRAWWLFGRLLDDVLQLDLEHQHLVRADRATRRALLAVTQLARDPEPVLAADRHQRDALLPARDHLPQCKHRRLVALVGAVERLAVQQRALVVHADHVVGGRPRAVTLGDDLVLQTGFGGLHPVLVLVGGQERVAGFLVLFGGGHPLGDALGLDALGERLAHLVDLLLGHQRVLA